MNLVSRVQLAALLALVGAAIVGGGGAAFTYFDRCTCGKALGLTHLARGIVMVGLALALLCGSATFLSLALFWSGVGIAYSRATEAVVLTDRPQPSGPDLGSLGGTLDAFGLLTAASVVLVDAA